MNAYLPVLFVFFFQIFNSVLRLLAPSSSPTRPAQHRPSTSFPMMGYFRIAGAVAVAPLPESASRKNDVFFFQLAEAAFRVGYIQINPALPRRCLFGEEKKFRFPEPKMS